MEYATFNQTNSLGDYSFCHFLQLMYLKFFLLNFPSAKTLSYTNSDILLELTSFLLLKYVIFPLF
jgi:hypothetical protein